MRGIVTDIYNTIGSILWPIFAVAMIVYVLYVGTGMIRAAFGPKPKVSEEDRERDRDEQW